MRPLCIAFLLLSAVITTAAEQSRIVAVRGWEFQLPAFLKQKITEGPDFTVTYLSSDERKITPGIYEGTAPQQFSDKKAGVAHEKVTIDRQTATWATWTEVADGRKQYHAEINFQIDPKATLKEQFHVFVTAATADDLQIMREAVGRARRAPNKRAGGKGGLRLCFMLCALGPPCLSTTGRLLLICFHHQSSLSTR